MRSDTNFRLVGRAHLMRSFSGPIPLSCLKAKEFSCSFSPELATAPVCPARAEIYREGMFRFAGLPAVNDGLRVVT